MTDQPILSVRGEVVSEVEPEIAHITFTITARDADRSKALRLLNERASAADGVLTRFSEAIEKVETSGIRVSPQLKFGKPRERVSGYVGVVHHTLTVHDFDRIGELVAQLANQDLTDVTGPRWALRPDSPVHRRARLDAVGDAVRRARDYADALGSELTDLVELADARLLSELPRPSPPVAMAAGSVPSRAHTVAPDELTFDLAPVRQRIQASVEARFRIRSPDLTQSPAGPT